MSKKIKVFCGGTCNGSLWRDVLQRNINSDKVELFNPVVENWTHECQEREIFERNNCDYCLYVITPKQTGFYSFAEVIDDSNKRPGKTIYCFLEIDENNEFTIHQIKSLKAIGKMVVSNGGKWFNTFNELIDFINNLD